MREEIPRTIDVKVLRDAVDRYCEESDITRKDVSELCGFQYKQFNQILGLNSKGGRRKNKKRVQSKAAIIIIRAINRDPTEFGL